MYMSRALVFSIEEFSTFDGPGIRTTVFLKGCPLKCSWCHNPEGQGFENEILKAQNGCEGCGECVKAGDGALNERSIAACPNRLLRWCGTEYTPESLFKKLSKNFDILKMAGGGVTFSGGEPLAHPTFLKECLARFEGHIHRAVQTCGYGDRVAFREVLQLADYFLFDLKLADNAAHERYTGVGNRLIHENFEALLQSGKPFTVRTPLIPGVTDTPENLTGIARFLKARGVSSIELLPYNKAAGGKYAAVGRTYAPDFDEQAESAPRLEIFESHHINATVL